jgi:hypothetical protein
MVRVDGVGVAPPQRSRLVFDASEETSTIRDQTDVTKIAIPRITIMFNVGDHSFQKTMKRARRRREGSFQKVIEAAERRIL